MICEICGKRMWFWQNQVMSVDKFGNLFPISHDKCVEKLDGKPYFEKKK